MRGRLHESAGGMIFGDEPVHCALQIEGGYLRSLCGLGITVSGMSWVQPALFLGEANQCLDCAAHPDLPLHTLGDIP